MNQRGRKSAAQLSVISPLRSPTHLRPPSSLSEPERAIGDEPYKRDWCETEQQLHDYSAAVTLRGWPATALSLGWRRAKRAIKHSALAWGAVVRARSLLARWRKPVAEPRD